MTVMAIETTGARGTPVECTGAKEVVGGQEGSSLLSSRLSRGSPRGTQAATIEPSCAASAEEERREQPR